MIVSTDNPWQKIDEEVKYDNSWIKVTHSNVINPAGAKGIYGSVHFKKNEDGTYTYTDQYDFNDAKEGGMQDFRDEVARREEEGDPLTAYQKVRLFAKYMGSGPGEGANVKIIS